MLCTDILREVLKYLTVRECLDVEVALHKKIHEKKYYKIKLKYQPYYITSDKYNIIGYYENCFKCDIYTKDYNMCLVRTRCGNSTKEACIKALDLFGLKIVKYNPIILKNKY